MLTDLVLDLLSGPGEFKHAKIVGVGGGYDFNSHVLSKAGPRRWAITLFGEFRNAGRKFEARVDTGGGCRAGDIADGFPGSKSRGDLHLLRHKLAVLVPL